MIHCSKIKSLLSLALMATLALGACSESELVSSSEDAAVDYVNPYMGGISHLLEPTTATVHLPNSMLRIIPQRKDYSDDQLKGLPILLTSHRGTSAFHLSPLSELPDSLPTIQRYTYDHEEVRPYEYKVYLQEAELNVRFAPSHQSAIYQLDYEGEAPRPSLVVHTPEGELKAVGKTLSGYQQLNDSVRVYLYMETDQAPERLATRDEVTGGALWADSVVGKTLLLSYAEGNKLGVRYGVSYISTEQARRNMLREIQSYSFNLVAKEGRYQWAKALGKIEVEGASRESLEVFYTSLYRTYERMINISEDGQYYSASLGRAVADEGTPFYTDDWVWDSYIGAHPLRILLNPRQQQHILTSYIRMAEQTPEGWIPTFPEVTGDSHRMHGNHGISLFADAYAKGLTGFDLGKAYELSAKTLEEKSLLPWTRLPREALTEYFHQHGYFPALAVGEKETFPHVTKWEKRQSVAVSLASSYDYWTLSRMASQLGRTEEARQYLTRAYDYRKLFNYETSFFHPRTSTGQFVKPMDYELSGGLGARDYYDENNGYTYRWYVQHNPADLIYLMGGESNFIRNLDETFRTPLSMSKWEFYSKLPDQTGNVGQFSIGNEVGLHIPYLYNYAGVPWRTQRAIHRLLSTWFRSDLMGVPGDEDGGGLSSFVVFSMMGIYPVTPGLPIYNIGTPHFEKMTLHLDQGLRFVIKAENLSKENFYIQSAKLNGKTLDRPWLKHNELIEGGELVLEMGARPNKSWGASMPPPSAEALETDSKPSSRK